MENNAATFSSNQALKSSLFQRHRGSLGKGPSVEGGVFVILTNKWDFNFAVVWTLFGAVKHFSTYCCTFLLLMASTKIRDKQSTRYFYFKSCAKTATILLKVSKYPNGSKWAAKLRMSTLRMKKWILCSYRNITKSIIYWGQPGKSPRNSLLQWFQENVTNHFSPSLKFASPERCSTALVFYMVYKLSQVSI